MLYITPMKYNALASDVNLKGSRSGVSPRVWRVGKREPKQGRGGEPVDVAG